MLGRPGFCAGLELLATWPWSRALLWAGVLLACGSRSPERSPPPLDPTALPWNRSAAAVAPNDSERLLQAVARRRGLDLRARPRIDEVARDELIARAQRHLETQTPASCREAMSLLWSGLELLPPELDWERALRRALELHLQAFYEPEHGRISLDRDLDASSRRRVLAHELVHALADQHFALGARLADPRATSDQQAVLSSIAEGDASALVAELWGEPAAESSRRQSDRARGVRSTSGEPSHVDDALTNEALRERRIHAASGEAYPAAAVPNEGLRERALPAAVARALGAAYVDGEAAVRRALAVGGWRAVDALYREAPRSTHELLHGHVDAAAILTPTAPPGAAAPVFEDVLGEQAWRTILEEWLPPAAAASVASAWKADRLSLFRSPAGRALLWEIRGAEPEARAAADAVRRALRLPLITEHPIAVACRPEPRGGVVGHWRRGPSVFLAWLIEAGASCDALLSWARARPPASGIETRVGTASSVLLDPTHAGTNLIRVDSPAIENGARARQNETLRTPENLTIRAGSRPPMRWPAPGEASAR